MASQIIAVPYSSETFHTIPDLAPVRQEFDRRECIKFVKDVLGPLIMQHGLDEVFGVGLVHRYFDIDPKTKLVEFNYITTPWCVANEDVEEFFSSRSAVHETSWMLNDNGKWMAYEFAYAPHGRTDNHNIVDLRDEKYHNFIIEYTRLIKEAGYDKLLGLRAWPGKDFRGGLETTEGTTNIVFKPGEFQKNEKNNYSETMFFFNITFGKGNCLCDCGWTKTGFHLIHNHIKTK